MKPIPNNITLKNTDFIICDKKNEIKKDVEFNAQNIINKIKDSTGISHHEKDKALALELQKKINPFGEDGNCCGCAFHTCMALLGYGT